MPKRLPPLQHVPNLERLLAPGEAIIYTVKLHPFYGWWFALLALACLALSYYWPLAMAGVVVFSLLYFGPLHKNEMAVTTHRLLLRIGRFSLATEAFDGDQLQSWRVHQNVMDTLLHTGTVNINLSINGEQRVITLRQVWHPLSFIEALETLQPHLRGNMT